MTGRPRRAVVDRPPGVRAAAVSRLVDERRVELVRPSTDGGDSRAMTLLRLEELKPP
jgi:hypothetical protein